MKFTDWIKNLLPGWLLMTLRFKKRLGYWPNLIRPRGYSELLLLKLLRDDGQTLTRFVDKVAVREYVRHKIGEPYLIPVVITTDNPTRIQHEELPSSVVVKSSSGSGMVRIISDTSQANWPELTTAFHEWMNQDYSMLYRERAYGHVPRTLIVEEMLRTDDGHPPADYKFYVFAGKVKLFQYISGRGTDVRLSHYLPDGTPLPTVSKGFRKHDIPPAPEADLAELVRVAEIIGEGFDFVRVDLFWVDGHAYFGELTFYPGAAMTPFLPREFDRELGAVWRLGGSVSRKWAQPDVSPEAASVLPGPTKGTRSGTG